MIARFDCSNKASWCTNYNTKQLNLFCWAFLEEKKSLPTKRWSLYFSLSFFFFLKSLLSVRRVSNTIRISVEKLLILRFYVDFQKYPFRWALPSWGWTMWGGGTRVATPAGLTSGSSLTSALPHLPHHTCPPWPPPPSPPSLPPPASPPSPPSVLPHLPHLPRDSPTVTTAVMLSVVERASKPTVLSDDGTEVMGSIGGLCTAL